MGKIPLAAEGTSMGSLSHFDSSGASRMVNVASKAQTPRFARASAMVSMKRETLDRIRQRDLGKGDVLEVARLAGIMAAKRTSDLIPLCHPLAIDSAEIDFRFPDDRCLAVESRISITGRTGVEMEALTACAVTALTVYDMCKSVDRGMKIECIQLEEKSGGQSGHFRRFADRSDTLH
jgi:cyclic pyranopterin phosphate synthase